MPSSAARAVTKGVETDLTVLKGMTWKHDRGLAPMLATAERFAESHPGARIEWEARSLQDFADFPLDELAKRYDMVVLDHPFAGKIATQRFLVPLDEHITPQVLATLEKESVGASHRSYAYDGHQWALAIDAAAQVAAYGSDLLEAEKVSVPRTWEEVLELGRIRQGFVTVPLLPADALMCFFTLCANSGEPPFEREPGKVATEETGIRALERLKVLAENSLPGCLEWNPVAVWERMSTTEEIAYCPLGFGYSNYARPGYRKSILRFTNIPSHGDRGPVGSTLGGAGLGISVECRHLDVALEYAQWVAGAECQRTLYFQSGGQPANRRAWTDPEANRLCNGFFESTLLTLDRAYVRPRFPRFVEFQTAACEGVSDFLRGRQNPRSTLALLEQLYRTYQK